MLSIICYRGWRYRHIKREKAAGYRNSTPTSANRNMSIPTAKKDKGAAAPEARKCTHCYCPVSEGSHGTVLEAFTRHKATHHCGRACQTAHWQAGHKQFYVTPEERAPQPASTTHMQPLSQFKYTRKTCGRWSAPCAWTRSPRAPPCARCPARASFTRVR